MKSFQFQYEEYPSMQDLPEAYAALLRAAQQVLPDAHAPYSQFHVGAAVLLGDGQVMCGVNIENASYPVGICAERSALSSVISQYPHEKIEALAVSYRSKSGENNTPAFPCGMCRQFISECEDRNHAPITLILGGLQGPVTVIYSAKHLLPFSFGGKDLQ